MNEDCIFCKIAGGVISSNTVYEDDNYRAVLDISPANKGHVLILPKEHFADLLSADDETIRGAFSLAKKIALAVKKATNCDGINIVQNNGEAAGQTVGHLHVHIIPRFIGDGKYVTWEQHSFSDEEQKNMAALIADALKD